MSETEKRKCFVITPIGNNDSVIRRHIDGIIDQAIIPALNEKYQVEVAHRKYEIGSINERVIKSIYEADLVIANLTTLNPNVMFELAIRYSFGKPAIVIAEEGTKLPFDIVDENTIFYINDPAGANDLRQKISVFENNINLDKQEYGPVYKAISKIPLYTEVESGENVPNDKLLTYIIERLDSLEKGFNATSKVKRIRIKIINVFFEVNELDSKDLFRKELDKILGPYSRQLLSKLYVSEGLEFRFMGSMNEEIISDFLHDIKILLNQHGVEEYTVLREQKIY